MIDRQQFEKDVQQLIASAACDAHCFFGTLNSEVVKDLAVGEEAQQPALVRTTPAWEHFIRLYEYACLGVQHDEELAPMEEDFVGDVFFDLRRLELVPVSVKDVVLLGEARFVLEGGERQLGAGDARDVPKGHLTVYEVTALADMDIGSVRNAMSPKSPRHLVGHLHGTRAVITVAEARRWLAQRRGFVPTTKPTSAARKTARVSIELPQQLADRLAQVAAEKGLSVERFLAQQLKAAKEPK
jgi:hypothetical protein